MVDSVFVYGRPFFLSDWVRGSVQSGVSTIINLRQSYYYQFELLLREFLVGTLGQ